MKVKVNHTTYNHPHPPPQKTLTKVFSTSGPNLVILTWTGDELWYGQTQNGVNLTTYVKVNYPQNQ